MVERRRKRKELERWAEAAGKQKGKELGERQVERA
jgi:hypothetical protein